MPLCGIWAGKLGRTRSEHLYANFAVLPVRRCFSSHYTRKRTLQIEAAASIHKALFVSEDTDSLVLLAPGSAFHDTSAFSSYSSLYMYSDPALSYEYIHYNPAQFFLA
jgi:hypothetical protein